jgi:hypothetical protein
MTSQTLDPAGTVRLVVGVARLGENDLRGWWHGHAMDRTGRYVLSGMFRRTWRSAAIELDMAAASRLHSDLLNRPTAIHLFSDLLPYRRWTASWLAEQKTCTETDPLLSTVEGWNSETAVESLQTWSGEIHAPQGELLGEGILLGRIRAIELADPHALLRRAQLLTSAYLYQTGPLRPPYFDLDR